MSSIAAPAADSSAPARPDGAPTVRCSLAYREAGLPIVGSAPVDMTGWLMFEHPGPWPRKGLPDDVAPELRDYLDGIPERVQMIRPVAGRDRLSCRVYLSLGFGPLAVLDLDDPDELLGYTEAIDAARAAGEQVPAGFAATTDRPLLVCTHGRRDVCCAQWGRPAAVALAQAYPDQVWETTHLGGHRFAVNMVTPPSPFYFGQLTAGHIVEVAEAVLAGQVPEQLLRGRAGVPPQAQAAEQYIRHEHGLTTAADATVRSVQPAAGGAAGADVVDVTVDSAAGAFVVTVQGVDGPMLPSSCGAEPVAQRTYTVLDARAA